MCNCKCVVSYSDRWSPFFHFSWDQPRLFVDSTLSESLCHRGSHDQPQSGSFSQWQMEAEDEEPGNEVDSTHIQRLNSYKIPWDMEQWTDKLRYWLKELFDCTLAKPSGWCHAALLNRAKSQSTNRGACCSLHAVQNWRQCSRIHSIQLCCKRSTRRKGKTPKPPSWWMYITIFFGLSSSSLVYETSIF